MRDGQKIFHQCVSGYTDAAILGDNVTIAEIDTVIGAVFEEIIADLYRHSEGCIVKETPDSHDYGADVVALYEDGKRGLLLQCKHKDNPSNSVDSKGVQEVFASVNYYKDLEDYKGVDFKTAVITNAVDYTSNAKKIAERNGVCLIAREELKEMLEAHPLPNLY